MWVPTGTFDAVFYERDTSPIHQMLIIGHELGHLLAGHRPAAVLDPDAAKLLLPDLDPQTVQRFLGRSNYAAEEEREAEMIGSLLLRRLRDSSNPAGPEPRQNDPEAYLYDLATAVARRPRPVAADGYRALRLLRRHPTPARRALCISFGAFTLGVTLAIPPLATGIETGLGLPNLAKVLAHGCAMTIAASAEHMLLYLALPAAQAATRTRRWVWITADAYLVMVALYAHTLGYDQPVQLTVEYATDPAVSAYLLILMVAGFLAYCIDTPGCVGSSPASATDPGSGVPCASPPPAPGWPCSTARTRSSTWSPTGVGYSQPANARSPRSWSPSAHYS